MNIRRAVVAHLVLSLIAVSAAAQTYPGAKEGTWVAREFRFHTGEIMSELRLHYWTVGEPSGEPVLILHGTTQSGASMLAPPFAGELFGPGQPLDASRYFIVLPDAIGHGQSGKPSDGLRAKFPRYNYDDMVDAHYLLLTEGLRLRHLRMVLGNSMGGMQTWIWGVKHPDARVRSHRGDARKKRTTSTPATSISSSSPRRPTELNAQLRSLWLLNEMKYAKPAGFALKFPVNTVSTIHSP